MFLNGLFGQNNCYQTFYQKGIESIQLEDFETAINNFKAAKVCSDKPSNNDIDDKILAAQNGYINIIQKERKRAQSLALTAKSILELQKNDNATTAFRYAEYALEKDDNSESRSAFYEAAYQLESLGKRLVYTKSFKPVNKTNENVKKVDFTRGGNFITVFSSDRDALVFDLEGQLISSKKIYFNIFDRNSISADETAVAYIGKDDLVRVHEFSAKEPDELKEKFSNDLLNDRIETMAFSPMGHYFSIGFQDGQTALYTSDGKLIAELKGYGPRISSLSFSKDDSLLVTGNNKGVVSIWNTDGSLLDTITIPRVYDTEVVISPDKKHLLISSSQRRVRLLTIEGEEVFRTEGYFWDISENQFSPKGDYVALENKIYSLQNGTNYGKIIQTLPDWINRVQFSNKDLHFLASGNNRVAQIWKRNYEWEVFANLGGHTDHIVSAALSPDGKTVVTAGNDLTVKIWPVEAEMSNAIYDRGKLLRPVIIEDSTYVITHKGKDVYLWNTVTGYNGFYGLPVEDVIAQSFDGKQLLAVENEMANIWRFDPSGEGIRFMAGVSAFHPVKLAQFSKDKKAAVMFLRDELFLSLTVWDLVNQKTRALGGFNGDINALEWTIDGKQLLIGNIEGEVIVWNYETPLKKMTIQKQWFAHDRQPISHIAVSPDGAMIATASWDNTTKLWSAEYEYLLTLRGHNMEINSVDFSPDSRFIITTSEDRTAKIWDAQGQLIVTLEGYASDVKRAYFSPDMNYVVTNYGDGSVKIWPFSPKLIKERMMKFTDIDLDVSEKKKYGIE